MDMGCTLIIELHGGHVQRSSMNAPKVCACPVFGYQSNATFNCIAGQHPAHIYFDTQEQAATAAGAGLTGSMGM